MKNVEHVRSVARATVFKAMGHPSRVFILEKLQKSPHCVCELAELVGADISTVSRHLAVLRSVGVVTAERRGNEMLYQLTDEKISEVCDLVRTVLVEQTERQSVTLSDL